jgi:tetratricopeptide (TPR) repeat protein
MVNPSISAQELLRLGLTHHKAGHLTDAEACYRQVLAIQPDHPRPHHLLGLVAHQAGRHGGAAELIRQAIRLDGGNASYFSDLGAVLKQQGKLDEAVVALRQAIRIKPDLAEAHCNLGAALRDQGKLDEAIAACGQAIRIRPDYAEGHSNLAVLLFDQGKLKEAVAAFSHAVRIEPANAVSHFNLGFALRAQGKLDEAVAACREAIRIRPDYAEAHSSLGALLCDQGRLDEAIAACRQAIRIRPGYAEAHSNLGIALYAQRKLDEAVAAHRHAICIAPANAEAHSNLGIALSAQGKLDDAVAAHRQAVRIKPDYAEGHSNLGRALHDQNRVEEAVGAFRQAIALKPDFANAYNNLGLALRALGRLSEGRTALEEAVRLAPDNASYERNLSEIARFVMGDSRLASLEQWAQESAALPPGERIEMHFALAKAYEDLGRHEEAFRHWLDGNALKRRQIAYDEAATLEALDRTREIFTSELFETRQNVGQRSSVPVFIVGMMRSGTTLVEQILASHPQVFGAGELTCLTRAMKGIQTTFGGSASFPELVPGMTDADFRGLGTRYLAEIERLAPAATHITDKMPGNFVFAGLIHLALPNATIIHTIRDPVDTCLSCFSKLFAAEQNHTYDLRELGRYYRHYQALMAHWHTVLPAGRILDVRYEDVVADLEGQARRIVAHCGLDWDPRCLAFHQTERPVRTASATQVRQPIYGSSVGRWRVHEPFLGPLLAELGIAGDVNRDYPASTG